MSVQTNHYIHTSVLDRFGTLMARGRLAHAYLFVGPRGVGKVETAIELAQLVNCAHPINGRPCHSCDTCQKIQSHNHPDVRVIREEEESSIKIEAVRDLIQQSQLRPYEARMKVFVLQDVERMTAQAGNALLKTLEEPSKNSMIILTTAVAEANLDTIRSRCQTVFFAGMTVNDLAQTLQNDYDIEPLSAECLARFSEGSLGFSVAMLNNRFFDKKNRVFDEYLGRGNIDAYIKKLASEKKDVRFALRVLWTLFRDVLLCKIEAKPRSIIHQDRMKDVKAMAARYTTEDVCDILEEIQKTMAMARDNFNVKIGLSLIKELV